MSFDGEAQSGVVDGPADAAAAVAVEEDVQLTGGVEEGAQPTAGDEAQAQSPGSATAEEEEGDQPCGEGVSRSSTPIQCGQRSPAPASQGARAGGDEDHHSQDAQQAWWEGDAEWERNMEMLPSVQPVDVEEEEEAARVALHRREIVFGFAAVCGEFRLPMYSSQHDRHDRLLCGQFVSIDTERCLFLVVGIDPLRAFEICLRLANTRTRGICRFDRANDIFAMVKSRMGRADGCWYAGVSIAAADGGGLKFSRGRSSVSVTPEEGNSILTARSCIQVRVENLMEDYAYANNMYLTWMQELAVELITKQGEEGDIPEAAYKKLLRERSPRRYALMNEMFIYYNKLFKYHSNYIFNYIKSENKYII